MERRNIDDVISSIIADRETIESSYWKHVPTATQYKIQERYKGNVELFKYWFGHEVLLPAFEFISFVWEKIVGFLRQLRDELILMNLGGK